jgi:tetratricopeptide (TPR) repeat protein
MRPLAYSFPALALVLAAALLPSGPAAAQDRAGAPPSERAPARAGDASPEELARRHHARGTSLYNLGQFEEAISEYRRGYEQKADPVFLYNIAQAYRQLGAPDKALFFYRRYLSTAPDSSNRRQVEATIKELEGLVAAEMRARSPAPPQPLSGATVPPDRAAFLDPSAQASADPGPDRPVWHRWGFWAGMGTLVAGGLLLGLLVASSRGDQPTPPQLGSMRFF